MMKKIPIVELRKSSCPRCGSTEHTNYHNVRTPLLSSGITSDGREYNCIVWRRTSCKICGQSRIDKSYEHRMETAQSNVPQNGQIDPKPKPRKKPNQSGK